MKYTQTFEKFSSGISVSFDPGVSNWWEWLIGKNNRLINKISSLLSIGIGRSTFS